MKKNIATLFLIVSLLLPSVSQAMTASEISSYISILQNLLNQIVALSGGANNLAEVISSTSALKVGDTVKTATAIGVRNEALAEIGSQVLGSQGTIVSGPMVSRGFTWWNINFSSGTDGWVKETSLSKVTLSPVITEPVVTPAPAVTLTATPTSITAGQSATLSWSSTNTTSCAGSGKWEGVKALSGTQVVTPTVTSTYTINCVGTNTANASQTVTVTVNTQEGNLKTPTLTFTPSPTSITAGNSSTLTWSSVNTTSCTASNGWTGTRTTSGTQTVSPTTNTTYTLSCTGANGTVTQSVTVSVGVVVVPPPPYSGTFSIPTLGTKDFESGLWSTAPAFTNGGGADPGYNSGGYGHKLVNNPTEASSGNWSYQFDYIPATVEHGGNNEAFRTSNGLGANADEMYWSYDFKVTGTPINTQLKWMRMRPLQGDIGGLYITGGSGTSHLGWAFGTHDIPNGNFNHAIGVSLGTFPAGLVTTYGYKKYAENILNDGKYHRVLVHYQQNPPGGLAPRVRFWFDGVPIVQSPTQLRNALNSQVYNGGAVWNAPNPNDPDYGANAPSWLSVGTRSNAFKIFTVDMNVTLNAGNTGAGRINYDNMQWSTKAINPTFSTGTPPPPVTNQPTLTLTPSPTSITAGQSATLTWSSVNTTSCTASNGWTGTRTTSGTQTVSPTVNTTYDLTCTGTGGSASQSATVSINAVSGPIVLPAQPLIFQVPMPIQTGKLWSVAAGDSSGFQTALNQAVLGDTIELVAGSTYTGNFTFPKKTSGSGWIIVRSNKHTSLPNSGTRVSPSDAVNMPKIVSPNTTATLSFPSGSHHYRLIGLDVTNAIANTSYTQNSLVGIYSNTSNAADIPNNITLDRMYIHSQPTTGLQRCVHADGSYLAIMDSYLGECHAKGYDSQAIGAWNTNGPIKIVNNMLEGVGENVMFGGADPLINGANPSDIEVRGNYIYTPGEWNIFDQTNFKSLNGESVVWTTDPTPCPSEISPGGYKSFPPRYVNTGSACRAQHWSKKNLFEFKTGKRVLIEGNVLDGSWGDGQVGHAFVIKTANPSGKCTWCQTADITIRYNIVKNVAGTGGVSGTSGVNNGYIIGGKTSRVLFEHNKFENINLAPYQGVGRLIEISNSGQDVTYRNNTWESKGTGTQVQHFISAANSPATNNFTYVDNIAPFGFYGIVTSYSDDISSFITGYLNYSGNVVYGPKTGSYSLAKYPRTPIYPDYASALVAGKGANMSAVLAATKNAINGGGSGIIPPPPSSTPTLTLTPSPTSITAGNSSTLTWSSTNVTSCTASNGWTGTRTTSGTQTVSPTANTTYTLTCTGANGTVTQSATVNVSSVVIPPPTTNKFLIGDSVQSNSNLNVRSTPSTAESTVLGTQPLGSLGKIISGPTTAVGYTWWNVDYVNAPDGWSVENYIDKTSAVVTPPPPPVTNQPTLTLTPSPTSITAGNSSTLTWSSTNVTSCTASNGWTGTRTTSGTQTVSPTVNTTYDLTCTGTGGSASQSASVAVGSTTTTLRMNFIGTQTLNVFAGFNLIGSVFGDNGASTSNVDVTVQNPIPNSTFKWAEGDCCIQSTGGYYFYKGNGDIAYRISTSASTPPGSYTVVLTAKDRANGATKTLNIPVTVLPAPQPLATQTPGTPPTLPAMTKYVSDMKKYGLTYCNSSISPGVESGVWYYDGERVYYNLSDYTSDPTWGTNCAQSVESMYRNYVITSNGGVPGWRRFSKGLRMDFERTGDAQSQSAALMLAKTASYPLKWNIEQESSREIAYSIDAMIDAEKLGAGRNPKLQDMVDLAVGHMDQWVVSKNANYLPPFMLALTSEALIGWYELTGDARVPVLVKTAADFMWNTLWDATSQSFPYYDRTYGQGSRKPAPDLNNLISPIYGWLYYKTGDISYVTKGDQLFTGGVNNGWLGNGKQFSQNYRWSMNYLKWTGRIPNINIAPLATNGSSAVVLGASTNSISVGDVVQTTANLNVRDSANGALLGKQSIGMSGTVKAGPITVGGYMWWNIDYQDSLDGWSIGDYLLKK